MSLAPFSDMSGGYIQEGILATVESWKKCKLGRYDLSSPPGDIIRREFRLSLVFVQC